jgi:N-acyl-D-amino-acid deacylase
VQVDTLFRKSLVVDGSGGEPFTADVGVRGGRIAAVGPLPQAVATRTVDARGLCLSPGFIDIHSHSDLSLTVDPLGLSKITQGVTTEVVGNCSYSPFPCRGPGEQLLRPVLASIDYKEARWGWSTLDDYATALDADGLGLNVCLLVGHAAVRTAVMGMEQRAPTPVELAAMRDLVTEAMDQGAFGFSVGLTLAPSAYADTDEVIALAREAGRAGGIYAQHSRIDARRHADAVAEAVRVSREGEVRAQVSHQKIVGRPFWGQIEAVLGTYAAARDEGVDIAFDLYPYLAGSSQFNQLLPQWSLAGGIDQLCQRLADPATRRRIVQEMEPGWFGGVPWDWESILLCGVDSPELKPYEGLNAAQAAERAGRDPLDAMLWLLEQDQGNLLCAFFTDCEENVTRLMRHPLAMIGSDGLSIHAHGPLACNRPHPRYYGGHSRVLAEYVRRRQVLSLPEAVHKMTALPAGRLGLRDRGRIREGAIADLVLFAPDRIEDRATYQDPHQYTVGVELVMVGGETVLESGRPTGHRPGRVLRHSC